MRHRGKVRKWGKMGKKRKKLRYEVQREGDGQAMGRKGERRGKGGEEGDAGEKGRTTTKITGKGRNEIRMKKIGPEIIGWRKMWEGG